MLERCLLLNSSIGRKRCSCPNVAFSPSQTQVLIGNPVVVLMRIGTSYSETRLGNTIILVVQTVAIYSKRIQTVDHVHCDSPRDFGGCLYGPTHSELVDWTSWPPALFSPAKMDEAPYLYSGARLVPTPFHFNTDHVSWGKCLQSSTHIQTSVFPQRQVVWYWYHFSANLVPEMMRGTVRRTGEKL
jgi:hypothetical protein